MINIKLDGAGENSMAHFMCEVGAATFQHTEGRFRDRPISRHRFRRPTSRNEKTGPERLGFFGLDDWT